MIEQEDNDELTAAYLAGCHDTRKAYEQRLAEAESKLPRWIPVGEQMPKDKKPIYMIALVPERNYTTDQYAGWYILGEWSRWPHRFPPTHWSYQIDNPEGDL
jgi:hypothetical protein